MDDIKRNITDYFSKLSFEEEGHTYSLGDKKLKQSVSDIIKGLTRKVDFYSIAKRIDQKSNLPEGTTKRMWKLNSALACAAGDKAHYFGEIYAEYKGVEPTDKLEEAVVSFWNTLPPHLELVATELTMYHKEYLFGGTMDILLYNKLTGKFLVVDWKTNKKLFKEYKDKTLKVPFRDLAETNYNKYQLQFSLYQILFEQTGYEVERRLLVWLKRDGTFTMYDAEDYTERLKEYLHKKLGKGK